ncbi:MAG: DNA helicase-2/ATP-dependent DNA helicase PcrA [Candidatus Paceibacteria bacterium]|jgi:DNA helicase-2/ATP-dependent DNA helicase PcrA
MKLFKEMYGRLNKAQKQAVDTIDGPVFVMAGPGTGKTQILTLRIANIIKETDIDPENILALTFTNAASYNMRERLSGIVGPEAAHRVYISTFHSFAEDMMKKYADLFDGMYNSRLTSPIEQIEIIESITDKQKTEYFSVFKRRDGTLRSIAFALSKIKSEGLTADEFRQHTNDKFDIDLESPDMFYKRKYGDFQAGDMKPSELRKLTARRDKNLELAGIYEVYEAELQKRELYDFDDVIVRSVHELQKPDSLFRAELQEQFQYLLVDEHQDTNDAQNSIVHALIDNPVWEGKPNLFVVGDSKQAIFRFAGASEESYNRLLSSLTDPVVINLEENYRSHQGVLDSSHSLITKSDQHSDEIQLQAFFNHAGVLEYREFHDYKMEVLWVALNIKEQLNQDISPNDIAVLYRNNKDADDVRRLFDILGIPYKDFSKKNILIDPDMQKILYLLRVIHNPTDNEAVAKSLFIDFLMFDVFDVQRILQKSRNAKGIYNKSIITILEDPKKLTEAGIQVANQDLFIDFVGMLKEQKAKAEGVDAVTFFSDFVRESGFLKYILAQKDSVLGLKKIEKLFDELKKESAARNEFTLDHFIHYLMTMKKHGITMNVTNTLSDGVTLSTFHGSKGLEFDNVYMIKALQKRKMGREISLPFAEFDEGASEDERRLFYVATTRAKKNCYMSSFVYNEEGREKNRSIHVDEMDGIEHIDMSGWEKEHVENISLFFNESNEHIVSLIDVEYIKERFTKNKLSVSALNNYTESPLKYFFRNLVFLPEARSPFLDFGNMIHGTLEKYFDACITAQQILSKKDLENAFKKVIEQNHLYTEYEERAWNILGNYFDRYKNEFEVPMENEKRISAIPFQLDSGEEINLTGVMDKMTKDENGNIVVWDYKTGRAYSDMDKDRKTKTKRQAAFYKLLLQNAFNGQYNFHTAIFDFIEPNSKGEYERAEFEITQADVDEVSKDINQLAQDIFDGTLLEQDFYKDPGNKELLEFLEVLRGPRTYEQLPLL